MYCIICNAVFLDTYFSILGINIFDLYILSSILLYVLSLNGRWGEPEEMGGCAVFLASTASDYVTGVSIPIDGGYVAF